MKKNLLYHEQIKSLILGSEEEEEESEKLGVISTTQAINLSSSITPAISKRQANDAIERMVMDYWLFEEKGDLSLGVRSLLELRPYLKELYGDHLAECVLCSELVTRGDQCENCKVKLHENCSRRLFSGKDVRKCPSCAEPWTA